MQKIDFQVYIINYFLVVDFKCYKCISNVIFKQVWCVLIELISGRSQLCTDITQQNLFYLGITMPQS